MPLLSRLRRSATPASLLLLSVIAILAISIGLGVHAWSTARSHQQSVEDALSDYASMAAWERHRNLNPPVASMHGGIWSVQAVAYDT